MLKNKIFYLAEFSMPNMYSYTLHVLKMCDALNKSNENVELIIPYLDIQYSKNKIKKEYNLKSDFKISSIFEKKKKLNFFWRIFFSFKIYLYIKKKKNFFVISRSVLSSLMLATFNIKSCLEIHSEMRGITKYLFLLIKLNRIKKNLKFILINKDLIKKLTLENYETIILFDAVDPNDYILPLKKIKTYDNACAYAGSLGPGKGLKIITNIAKMLPNVNFHIYGNLKTIDKKYNFKNKPKNVIFKGFVRYSKLNNVLRKYKILLMPYDKQVGVLIENVFVQDYFSPLKLFDYMASGRVIIASNLKVYRNILKNNINSFLINIDDFKGWKDKIQLVFKNKQYNRLGIRAYKDVKNFTWYQRAIKIKRFISLN